MFFGLCRFSLQSIPLFISNVGHKSVCFATKAVVHDLNINDHFVRKAEASGLYSNVSFTNKAVISIEDNLVASVSQKRKLAFELKTADQGS